MPSRPAKNERLPSFSARQLRCGNIVIKEFGQPLPHPELIFAAFEEQGWTNHLDDPLPRNGKMTDRTAKRRLHFTIQNLNRNQRVQMIRFRGDGTGQGILWEFIES